MRKFSCMLVDDEILAIEHMRSLVDWDGLGFSIVSHAVMPDLALELVRELRPQLLIVDIKMPIMDGLEFVKRVQGDGMTPKVVLLTSFKEFDYAKEAIKLGVSNYWVKHEVDGSFLRRELQALRLQLEQEEEARKVRNRQLVGGLLSGTLSGGEDRRWPDGTGLGGRLHMLLLRRDEPFPVMGDAEPLGGSIVKEPDWACDSAELSLIGAARMSPRQFGILYRSEDTREEQSVKNRLEEAAVASRRLMEAVNGCTVSTVLHTFLPLRADMAEAVRMAEAALAETVFTGPRQWIRMDLREGWQPGSCPDPTRVLEEMSLLLKEGEAHALFGRLEQAFQEVAEARNPKGLQELCTRLTAWLNRLRTQSGLPALEVQAAAVQAEPSAWTSVDRIHQWFAGEVESALQAVHPRTVYSKKVERILAYMKQHYAKDLSADDIAAELCISSDYLRHMFKEETGQTLLDALTAIRIEHAKKLLAAGRLKIYEVAEAVGYRNSPYFSQVFRKLTGMNPMDYAENRRSDP